MGVRQNYIPSYSPTVPPEIAQHLTQLYTGLNQHDQILNDQATATNTSTSTTTQTQAGGATGTIAIPPVSVSGTQGSITVKNGLIMSFTNPT